MPTLTFMTALPALLLGLALSSAVWHDVRARRIPNRLVVAGTASALLLHLLLPAGAGLFIAPAGSPGVLVSLAGCGAGLLLLLPFYALRTMGAGDVKLMAMVGAFLGPGQVLGATLLSMLAGGVLALAVALWSGQLSKVVGNVGLMLWSAATRGMGGTDPRFDAPTSITGKLPYAIAIACGTLAQLALAPWPAWQMFT